MNTERDDRAIDAIEIEVFNNRMLAIIEEMGAKLVRSSFSPNIKERRDCSVALFDIKGRSIGQAAHIPIHLGSLKGGVDAILRDYPLSQINPGDALSVTMLISPAAPIYRTYQSSHQSFITAQSNSSPPIWDTTQTSVGRYPARLALMPRQFSKKEYASHRLNWSAKVGLTTASCS